jgi:hypothetical protein
LTERLAQTRGQHHHETRKWERPPGEFLQAAEEQIRLRQWLQEQEQEYEGEDLEGQGRPEPEAEGVSVEARRIWTRSLGELQLGRATFDTLPR